MQRKFVNNKKTLCWQGSKNFKSVIIHFWRILIYNGTFLFPSVLSEFRFYCFSLLLSIISWNENLLLHKLDFHIFCKLNRCKTQYLRIGLRYWFSVVTWKVKCSLLNSNDYKMAFVDSLIQALLVKLDHKMNCEGIH